LLPTVERFRYPGRKRPPDRQALQGIVLLLELGFGGGSTCYRLVVEWQRAGVWKLLHARLLSELRAAGELEWSRAIADSSHAQAKKGAPRRARARLTEPENGSKHHLLVDATGIPLAWTGGNRNDVTQLVPLIERVPSVRGKVGRPRRRPDRVTADRGYEEPRAATSSTLRSAGTCCPMVEAHLALGALRRSGHPVFQSRTGDPYVDADPPRNAPPLLGSRGCSSI
jgi:hypothetical protein